MADYTHRKDLTRWNRSGLSRFRYVNGNAASHLETLRQAMVNEFTSTAGDNQWSALETAVPVASVESPEEQNQRMLAQYRDVRRDYAWEILRAFARASHVLSEHMDAYANETFLETATQWDSVQKLCRMLDYSPAPPASAQTPLALLAKSGRSGALDAGFAVKDKPQDGNPPAIFETLDGLEVDDRLNELKARDWDKSQRRFHYRPAAAFYAAERPGHSIAPEHSAPGTHLATFPLDNVLDDVSAGTRGVLVVDTGSGAPIGIAVRVSRVLEGQLLLQGPPPPTGLPTTIRRHALRLLLNPAFRETPRINGSNVVLLDADDAGGLQTGALVAWQSSGSWRASRIGQVEANRIELIDRTPPVSASIYALTYSAPRFLEGESSPRNRAVLPVERKTSSIWSPAATILAGSKVKSQSVSGASGVLYEYLDASEFSAGGYYLADTDVALARVVATAGQALEFDGDAGELAGGDWALITNGSDFQARQILRVDEAEDSYSLTLEGIVTSADAVHAVFPTAVNPRNFDVNETPVFATSISDRSDSSSLIDLQGDLPEFLDVSRVLLVVGQDEAIETVVKAVDTAAGWIRVSPALPGSELSGSGSTETYTRYHTRIYGNVVSAGHGESGKQQVLGSGDATRSSQEFALSVSNPSFVADATMSAGVAAAVTIDVDGRTWQQVATLHDSEPEDPHYTVRVTEEGSLLIGFGDGWHGRRLPSGQNNVRASMRVGAGLSGNVAAGALQKIVNPHPLIEDIVQPILASGGNDMEGVESMRENAPPGVLSLSRAVSLSDFTHLAAGNSSVWQARAYRRQPGPGRSEKIDIAVVPAGGGDLGTLETSVHDFIVAHALPGVDVTVRRFEGVMLNIDVSVQVRTEEFDPDLVVSDVRDAVQTAFALERAPLGEPLFLSRIFQVVEQVQGVVNSQCSIASGGFADELGVPVSVKNLGTSESGAIKRISIFDWQVCYVDPAISVLNITARPFSL